MLQYHCKTIRNEGDVCMGKPVETGSNSIKSLMYGLKKKSDCIDLDYVATNNNFTFALCVFLDTFKRANIEGKYKLIENPPKTKKATQKNLCILAAVVHKLANDNNMAVPEWVHAPSYKMPNPIFAHDTTNAEYQSFLISDSPPEFAEKNIFYGSNAITRV